MLKDSQAFSGFSVDDVSAAVAFYRDVIGLTLATDQQYGSGWRWIEFEVPGSPTKILFEKRANEAPGEQPSLPKRQLTPTIAICHRSCRSST